MSGRVQHIRIKIDVAGPADGPGHRINTHLLKEMDVIPSCKDAATDQVRKVYATARAIGEREQQNVAGLGSGGGDANHA